MTPPAWAFMERELLRANSEVCKKLAGKYLDEHGYLLHTARWGTLDGTDDAIDTFRNWTLLHMLGASDSVLYLFKKTLGGHYFQYNEVTTDSSEIAKYGCYYKEFMPMSDWHYNGESMQSFMNQGMVDPTDAVFRIVYVVLQIYI